MLKVEIGRGSPLGTWYQGVLHASYADLVKVFGEPPNGPSGDGKVQVEWYGVIQDEGSEDDAEGFTIYDWKEEVPVDQVEDWHIGGAHSVVTTLVKDYFDAMVNQKTAELNNRLRSFPRKGGSQ